MIILAPNAFKGTLDAPAVCRIISSELNTLPEKILSLPIGDGGDGTGSIIASYLNAEPVSISTCDALGRANNSLYYRVNETAIIELAEICGIKHLQKKDYDVLNANTRGLGMAINQAVVHGARHILLCVGGSASIDGGTGALAEMGLTIVRSDTTYRNHLIDLKKLNTSNLKQKFKDITFTILCDVDNELCGNKGAAAVFGPQKGASQAEVELLDTRLCQYASLLEHTVHTDVTHLKHGGAAGGITASFAALLNARLISGADYCLDLSEFDIHLKKASLVITGEGRLDSQSLQGKIPGAVAKRAREHQIPVIAIAGSAENELPVFTKIFTLLSYAGSVNNAISQPEHYLRLLCKDLKTCLLNFLQNNEM